MRFGICASLEQVAALPSIPFDYLEENVQRFLLPEGTQADFERALAFARTLPVPIEAANSFIPAHLPLVATPTQAVDAARLERYVKTALLRAEQAGIRVIVFGSGDARACPPGFDRAEAVRQIADHFASWCSWAGDYAVQIVLEPLRYEETNTLNTVAECGVLVASHVSSGARLLADTYHMLSNGEDPATLLPVAALLSHVHVAELAGRAAPDQHAEDFRPYFSALHMAGYDQRISIECKWLDLPAEVERALAVLRETWASSAL